jgi:hypothetical protein
VPPEPKRVVDGAIVGAGVGVGVGPDGAAVGDELVEGPGVPETVGVAVGDELGKGVGVGVAELLELLDAAM